MTPIMVDSTEFVIFFDITTGNIKLRNPHGPETDGNYVLLKRMVEGLVIAAKSSAGSMEFTETGQTEKPTGLEELEEYYRKNLKNMVVRDAPFYKKILEVKERSEKLHGIGGEDPNSSGYYRAIAWVLKTIDEDTEKTHS